MRMAASIGLKASKVLELLGRSSTGIIVQVRVMAGA